MYIPKLFRVTNFEEIKQFIHNNSFGTIISNNGQQPVATHTPMLLRRISDQWVLTGHMAKANPQWKSFDQIKEQILAIFQGPHTYVSSSWYESENVPTWNYQAVHIYGKVQLMDENELIEDLTLLLETYETGRENAVLWKTLSDQTKQQLNAIIGFKIIVNDVQAAYKLSQNRNDKDYESIITHLSDGDDQAKLIAQAMSDRRNITR